MDVGFHGNSFSDRKLYNNTNLLALTTVQWKSLQFFFKPRIICPFTEKGKNNKTIVQVLRRNSRIVQ